MSVIGRTKKSEVPLLCCDTEMVKKEKTKFTEHPEPKAKSSAKKKTKAKTKRATKKKKAVEEVPEFPLVPGEYRCPTCGATRDLQPTDNRDKPLRCTVCFVKMMKV